MKKVLKSNMKALLFIMLGLFALTSFSCDKDDDGQATEQSVTLDTGAVTLNSGEELVVTPSFEPDVTPKRTYGWVTSNPEVAGISMNDDHSVVVTAKKGGTSTLTFSSSDGEVSASFVVTVPGPEDDGVLKVLAIGNSFSEDDVEQYLYELAAAEGVSMVIGNLYIGGASLDQHWTNAQENSAVYDYRKITQDGNKTNTANTSIETGVKDENWDYISFQQVSGASGQYETFVTPLPALKDYVQNLS